MNKFKKLLTILFASVTVAGGIAAGSISLSKGQQDVVETKADSTVDLDDFPTSYSHDGINYKVIYFFLDSDWQINEKSIGEYCYVYKYNSVLKGPMTFGSGTLGQESFSEIIGDFIIRIYLPVGATTIQFYSDVSATQNKQKSQEKNLSNSVDAYILQTNNWSLMGSGSNQTLQELSISSFVSNVHDFYFAITTNWNGGSEALDDDNYVKVEHYWDYSSKYISARYTKITSAMCKRDGKNNKIAHFFFYGTNRNINVENYSEDCKTNVISDLSSFYGKVFVVYSGNSGTQICCWVSYSNWPNAFKRIYFVPNEYWSANGCLQGTYKYCDPVLVYKNAGNDTEIVLDRSGVTEPNPGTIPNKNKKFVFYYDNIPLSSFSAMKFQHNREEGYGGWYVSYASSEIAKWENGTSNVFGIPNNNTQNDNATNCSGIFNDATNYYIAGSFVEYNDISWSSNWPLSNNTLCDYNGSDSHYLYVTTFDVFKHVHFNYLANTSTSGNTSGWDLNGRSDMGGYSFDIITLYVNGRLIDNLTDFNKYIISDNDSNIKFHRGGIVKISRDSTNLNVWAIIIEFFYDNRTHTLPSDYIIGVSGNFNDWQNTPIAFNNRTGRYEKIFAVFEGERFKFRCSGGSTYYEVAGNALEHFGPGASSSGEYGTDVNITSGAGLYSVGWCDTNNGSGGVNRVPFLYKLDGYDIQYDVKSVQAFESRLSIIKSCVAIQDNQYTSNNLKIIYDELCDVMGKSAIDNRLIGITIDDYSYEDYVDNSHSYEGLEKTNDYTNALEKYNYIQNYSSNSTRNLLLGFNISSLVKEEQTLNVIVIIVVSSISILSVAVLSILIVKKRKSKEQ